MRLDQYLVENAHFPSRARAQAAVLAGLVLINGEAATKAGRSVRDDDTVTVRGSEHPWVSRGGVKLAHALELWGISAEGRICLDAGSSTGGFTDVLIRSGAERVHAVDVGYGLIDWRLRQDPRVVLHERTNIRYVTAATLGEQVSLVTLDLAFIGLEKVFPAVASVLDRNWLAVLALVKPQFQLGKGKVARGGVVRDPALHLEALEMVREAGRERGWHAFGAIPSPIRGAAGNVEFWMGFGATPGEAAPDLPSVVRQGEAVR